MAIVALMTPMDYRGVGHEHCQALVRHRARRRHVWKGQRMGLVVVLVRHLDALEFGSVRTPRVACVVQRAVRDGGSARRGLHSVEHKATPAAGKCFTT